jgi:hypothetical protein
LAFINILKQKQTFYMEENQTTWIKNTNGIIHPTQGKETQRFISEGGTIATRDEVEAYTLGLTLEQYLENKKRDAEIVVDVESVPAKIQEVSSEEVQKAEERLKNLESDFESKIQLNDIEDKTNKELISILLELDPESILTEKTKKADIKEAILIARNK